MQDVRSFLDEAGRSWEVREICDPTLAIIPARQLRRPEFAEGWLLFTSDDGQRRRLAPIPPSWHALSESALARLRDDALPAGRVERPTADSRDTSYPAP